MSRVGIIGAGFSGLSSACFLANAGHDVDVYEKNSSPGGRARLLEESGFRFDMGPSWYWMPDVFDKFFAHFGKTTSDYYQLTRLDPSYQVIFPGDTIKLPADLSSLLELFESIEKGSSQRLSEFLEDASVKYELAMNRFVYQPGLSLTELMSFDLLKTASKLRLFQSVSTHVRRYFKSPRLIQLLEFPMLFLGAKPDNIPALYSLMNYADMKLGTWYPTGGMHAVVEAMVSLATSLGVKFHFNSCVEKIETKTNEVTAVRVNGEQIALDYLIGSGDYHHIEQELLPSDKRQHKESYWDRQVLAPSALIYFIGVRRKVKGLLHHNLFFDTDFGVHANEIYDNPKWPTAPQFYVCCPSKTDTSVAPAGYENLFVLIPTASGLTDAKEKEPRYLDSILTRMYAATGDSFADDISFCRSYGHSNFINDYNAFKGNAYGLANILTQTANLKPSIMNKHLHNMFYTGQLTVPGPGVPPAIISGEIVANQLLKRHRELVTS